MKVIISHDLRYWWKEEDIRTMTDSEISEALRQYIIEDPPDFLDNATWRIERDA